MDLFQTFFQDRDCLLNDIISLDRRHGSSIVNFLKKVTTKQEFLATITEAQFGLFFDAFADRLLYEHPVFANSPKTPDWTFTLDDQLVVAEVVRLNRNERDQKISDFDSELIAALKDIRKPVLLKLDCDEAAFNPGLIDANAVKTLVEDWLSQDRSEGETLTLFDVLTISVKATGLNTDHVNVVCVHSIKTKDSRLSGKASRLFSKVEKYAPLVQAGGFPFIVCLYLQFESWFEPEDLYRILYGHAVQYLGDFEHNDLSPGSTFHDLSKGLFYCNEQFRENISGVLVRYQETYTYFHNFSAANRLKKATADMLLRFQYVED